MTPTQQALLTLTAAGLDRGEGAARLDARQWDELFAMACQQNVAAQVCRALEQGQTDVPLDIKLKFATLKAQCANKYAHTRSAMVELLRLFNSHGIETMLVKGLSLSRLYPQPELRHFGDIDYYQFGRWQEADALVAATYGISISKAVHHHSKFSFRGLLVENHFDFISRYDNYGNKRFERLLKEQAAARRCPYTLDGEPCLLPPPTLAALFYLRHMAAHFAADRITLRHLVDWTLFCQADGAEADWALVVESGCRYGFLPFASAMEELCRRHFGHQPRLPLGTDDTLPDRILQEMLTNPFDQTSLHRLAPLRRIGFKWRRRWLARWKHDICFSAPWTLDLLYSIGAKLRKPHTILH